MSQGQAFGISEEDVANVLASNTMIESYRAGRSIEDMANALMEGLDFDAIEEAALMGDDMDQQTDYAHDEITKQLRAAGVLEELPDVVTDVGWLPKVHGYAQTLPPELLAEANKQHLDVEGEEVLFSSAQTDHISVDHWLGLRDGGLRINLRVLQKQPAPHGGYECILEGGFSDPIPPEQALAMIQAWGNMQRMQATEAQRLTAEEAEREDRRLLFAPLHDRGPRG